ncbi:SPFH domain-containing protein [uncultured Dokdonia sp.]|uniref:SPFH domain-containing protein n=1 Tax=uncultured Dokdonia sp. TaxID=575653 RepID=UPI00260ADEC5|nr:SPFH domain-containing protein [uncultured Dokdonia sp.]
MNYRKIFFLSIVLFSFYSCVEKSNTSRQFEKSIEARALSADGKEMSTNMLVYYSFASKESKLFDEQGEFIDKKEEGHYIVTPIIRSAVRSIIGRYSPHELSKKDKSELKNEIYDSVISTLKVSKNTDQLEIQIDSISLNKLLFSKAAQQSILKE